MNINQLLEEGLRKAISDLFHQTVDSLQLQPTNQEFEGTHTLVCFPITKISRKSPEETARMIGDFLLTHTDLVSRFNVVKGFLNLVLKDEVWIQLFNSIYSVQDYGIAKPNGREIMVEYSSPNTNKPLHLGHLRNNFLGYSVAAIYQALGYTVHKVQIINDRGIHICKSMAAWKLFGHGETPASSGIKGDHLVGKYYVAFERALKKELIPILEEINKGNFIGFNDAEQTKLKILVDQIKELETRIEQEVSQTNFSVIPKFGSRAETLLKSALDKKNPWKEILKCIDDEEFKSVDPKIKEQKRKELLGILKPILLTEEKIEEKKAAIKDIAQNKTMIMPAAQELLRKWENKDVETLKLWKTMNDWVYDGFSVTYNRMGVDFEKLYYESNTYLLGKQEVLKGVESGVFVKKEDGSVWVDLSSDGLDQKVLLRADGTSVYMTQDIGTAILRFRDFPKIEGQIYTVGNEQEYHFKVLFLILKKLGFEWAKKCFHLSYGMVDLPTGKMKSREGMVVDADDLMEEMVQEAARQSEELGKTDPSDEIQLKTLHEMVGLGALKYFLLKVDPKKRMMFDPNESIQLQGNTGPFIQYTHARIYALLRKAKEQHMEFVKRYSFSEIQLSERILINLLNRFPSAIEEAAFSFSPSVIANYTFELAKEYNQFYQSVRIFGEPDHEKVLFRIALSEKTADIIKMAMHLLGISVPEKM